MLTPITDNYLYADRLKTNSKVIIMVGVPRSGKSTKVKELSKEGYIPISCDDIFRTMGIRYSDEIYPLVENIMKIMCESMIIRGIDIIIDRTSATKKERKIWTDICKKHNVEWDFCEIETPPLNVLIDRCEKTNFPIDILKNKFLENFEPVRS